MDRIAASKPVKKKVVWVNYLAFDRIPGNVSQPIAILDI
jgi:hypothetical protein